MDEIASRHGDEVGQVAISVCDDPGAIEDSGSSARLFGPVFILVLPRTMIFGMIGLGSGVFWVAIARIKRSMQRLPNDSKSCRMVVSGGLK